MYKNNLLDYCNNEAMLRIAACLPDVIDEGSIRSIYALLPNLSDCRIDVNELSKAYIGLLRLYWQL